MMQYVSKFPFSSYSDTSSHRDVEYTIPVIAPKELSFGDYGTSCAVERSNSRVFQEQFSQLQGIQWCEVTGAYHSASIYILCDDDGDPLDADIQDCLTALSDYPCMDDEDMSLMEQDMFLEYLQENSRDILDSLGLKPLYDSIPHFDTQELAKGLYDSCDLSEFFCIESGGIVYFDEKRVQKRMSDDIEFRNSVYDETWENVEPFLPSGSGFDCLWKHDFTPDYLRAYTSYHYMNPDGYYDGYIEIQIELDGSDFISTYTSEYTGAGEALEYMRDYLDDTIHTALNSTPAVVK